MTHHSYVKVPKSDEYRIGELAQSLLVIRDSLNLLGSGNSHQVLPLAGQLRALLTDRTTKPLLNWVADSLGVDLKVWTFGGLRGKRGPDQASELLFGMQGTFLTASQFMADQREVPLSAALDAVVLHAEGTNYSARDIIEFLANQAGGAHFAEHLPRTLASVMGTVHLGNLPAPQAAVVQLGSAALDIGRRLLRDLCEVDFDLVMVIRRVKPEGPAFLFDARCPGSSSRYSAQVHPNLGLTFRVDGVGGGFGATAQNITTWERPHHVRFAHSIQDDMKSRLRVEVDGDVRLDVAPGPLVLGSADPAAFEVRLNGGFDDPEATCEWGLGGFRMSPPEAGYARASSLLRYRDTVQEKKQYRCMDKDQFLYKAVGAGEVEGTVQETEWRTWLAAAAG